MADDYTGADLFVDALERYGVTRVFGNPGTTELPVMTALGDSELDYVLGLHEDVAVGMAAGYASARRYHARRDDSVTPVGVVNLHVAPGLAHGLGNLYGASAAGAPLVVTAGDHATDFRHEEPVLGGDLEAMAEQFTKWSAEVSDVAALPTMLRRAFRVALTPPTGPVFLALPVDVMNAATDADPERLGEIPDAGRGDPAQIERAADLVAADTDDVAMVVGDGVARSDADAVDAAAAFAEASGARVHSEIMTAEIDFPTDHDQWLSHVPPDEAFAATAFDADVLVLAGTSTNTTLTGHDEPLVADDTTCIHLGDDAWEIGKNQPADAAVLGDPGRVLRELADAVDDRLDDELRSARLERLEAVRETVEEEMSELGTGEDPDDPRASKAELVDALRAAAGEAFVVGEGVTARQPLLARWEFAPEQYLSNKGGGLGYGLPASVGAALAEAETDDPRDVVGFVGDGSYLYYPQALYSAVRYDADLTVVVPDNRNYRILKDNTIEMFGGDDDDYEFVGMDFDPPVDIPANAESHGARGKLVDPDDIESAVAAAVDRAGPDVLDVPVHD